MGILLRRSGATRTDRAQDEPAEPEGQAGKGLGASREMRKNRLSIDARNNPE
jgi:hypothetical protein